jgi:hypothetical protein
MIQFPSHLLPIEAIISPAKTIVGDGLRFLDGLQVVDERKIVNALSATATGLRATRSRPQLRTGRTPLQPCDKLAQPLDTSPIIKRVENERAASSLAAISRLSLKLGSKARPLRWGRSVPTHHHGTRSGLMNSTQALTCIPVSIGGISYAPRHASLTPSLLLTRI